MKLESLNFSVSHYQKCRQLFVLLVSICLAVVLASCDTVTTDQYEATALTTLTWQVQYSINPVTDNQPRFEEFASSSLLNRNGEKPKDAVIGPDDKGLWWPKLPPRPTIDEVEQRQKSGEEASKPELLRTVKYEMTYQHNGQKVTLPTNYDVYRQVARAYPSRKPLQLTLGVNNGSVTKAEPIQ
ncbi:MAG: hypothetical protein Fur006_53310 [Coleofasciculaceae cyanobacterium]